MWLFEKVLCSCFLFRISVLHDLLCDAELFEMFLCFRFRISVFATDYVIYDDFTFWFMFWHIIFLYILCLGAGRSLKRMLSVFCTFYRPNFWFPPSPPWGFCLPPSESSLVSLVLSSAPFGVRALFQSFLVLVLRSGFVSWRCWTPCFPVTKGSPSDLEFAPYVGSSDQRRLLETSTLSFVRLFFL